MNIHFKFIQLHKFRLERWLPLTYLLDSYSLGLSCHLLSVRRTVYFYLGGNTFQTLFFPDLATDSQNRVRH